MFSSEKSINKLKKKGYKSMGHQHNGFLLGKIENGMTNKAVVAEDGRVRKYKPSRPNKYERKKL